MKRYIFLLVTLFVVVLTTTAQSGGITPDMLREIQQVQPLSPADKAISNAIAANSIDALAKNRDNARALDTYFNIETPRQSITDQQSSGRCWMFSGLNVLRSNYAQRDSVQLELSQAYLFFWDQLEKANLMLQGVIDTGKKPIDDQRVQFFFHHPINDGGTFCGVSDLAEKYGLVPTEVMPESYSTDNTSKAASIISSKLREYGLQLRDMVAKGKSTKDIQKAKTEMLGQIYRMLTLTIGAPVQQFTYAFKDKDGKAKGPAKSYTPQSFYQEIVGGPLNGTFIMAMNDPRRPYYKTYEVEYDRHTYDGQNWVYVNLPIDEIKDMAIASLKDNTMMYFSCDVGKFQDAKRGLLDVNNFDYGSLMGTTFGMDKKQRIQTFASGSTHAMTLTAVDLDQTGKPVKWMVENSWGADRGYQGFLIMTDEWFNEYMFRLVVESRYATAKVKELLKQTPVKLPAWDPMFAEEE